MSKNNAENLYAFLKNILQFDPSKRSEIDDIMVS